MKRPSIKEINNKLRDSIKAVNGGRIKFVNINAIACDALDLGYSIDFDLKTILLELLSKASTENYVGKKPPERSYEKIIEGFDLFAFNIVCEFLKCLVYFKFAIKNGNFYLVSLHK